MNFNTILLLLDIPNNFTNADNEPINTADGFIYEINKQTDKRACTSCRCNDDVINHI